MVRRPSCPHVQCMHCGDNHLPAESHDPRSRPCAYCNRYGHDSMHYRLARRFSYAQQYSQPYSRNRPLSFFKRGAALALPAPNDAKPTIPRIEINPTGIPRLLGPFVIHPLSDAPVHYVVETNEEEAYVNPYISYDEEGNPILMDY